MKRVFSIRMNIIYLGVHPVVVCGRVLFVNNMRDNLVCREEESFNLFETTLDHLHSSL